MLQGVMVMEQVCSLTQLTGGRSTTTEAYDPVVCHACSFILHGLGVVNGMQND